MNAICKSRIVTCVRNTITLQRAKVIALFILKIILVTFFVLLLVILIRSIIIQTPKGEFKCRGRSCNATFIPLTLKRLKNFIQALRFQTVANDVGDYNRQQLTEYRKFIFDGAYFYIIHFF